MTVSEVREVMRRMWAANAGVLGAHLPRRRARSGAAARRARRQGAARRRLPRRRTACFSSACCPCRRTACGRPAGWARSCTSTRTTRRCRRRGAPTALLSCFRRGCHDVKCDTEADFICTFHRPMTTMCDCIVNNNAGSTEATVSRSSHCHCDLVVRCTHTVP